MPNYKTQIMNRLEKLYGDAIITRKQIVQVVLDITRPGEVYDYKVHRGHYTAAFKTTCDNRIWYKPLVTGYFLEKGRGDLFLLKVDKGLYKLTR